MKQTTGKIFVCYVPGMNMQNFSKDWTPYISKCLTSYSWSQISTFPSNDLFSTLITGMHAHEHGFWQVKLKERAFLNGKNSFLARFPDTVAITLQSIRHQLFHNCDIPTIPPRRRRAFELRRLKFRGRARTKDLLSQLGHGPSIASCMGKGDFSYLFTDRWHDQKSC